MMPQPTLLRHALVGEPHTGLEAGLALVEHVEGEEVAVLLGVLARPEHHVDVGVVLVLALPAEAVTGVEVLRFDMLGDVALERMAAVRIGDTRTEAEVWNARREPLQPLVPFESPDIFEQSDGRLGFGGLVQLKAGQERIEPIR